MWGVFAGCATQWAYRSETVASGKMPLTLSRPCGIPAERVKVKAEGYGVKLDRDFWHRFEILESEALRAMAEG